MITITEGGVRRMINITDGGVPQRLRFWDKIRSILHCTLQLDTKRQDAICLRTVRVVVEFLFAFQVVAEVITPDLL